MKKRGMTENRKRREMRGWGTEGIVRMDEREERRAGRTEERRGRMERGERDRARERKGGREEACTRFQDRGLQLPSSRGPMMSFVLG